MGKGLLFTGSALACLLSAANGELDVLDGQVGNAPAAEMMQCYLDGIAAECFAARAEAYDAVKTAEDVATYQERMRSLFVERLGGFPERTPLNAQVVGGGQGDGFRYEKIIYESQPAFYVTAVLFLPLSAPPYPGVLVPCGHSDNGKAAETYQRASILLARNGLASLCFDPVGQGERYYYFNAEKRPQFGTTLQHTAMGVGAILTGANTAAYMIWDGIRGIDYLQSRADIDGSHIGCTGNSGGGTQTSYLMALDPRIECAAPSCYLTSFPKLLATAAPQDAEQNIFGQVAFGMGHADYIHMRAPRPTLMCTATHDFFDIQGSWDTFREAKRFYARLGYAERADIIEVDDEHGFSRPRREAAVRWMRRWLLKTNDAITEPEFAILSDQEMQCTPDGQVMCIKDARSVPELSIEREARLAKQRRAFWRQASREEALAKVSEVVGARRFTELDPPEAHEAGKVKRKGYRITKLEIQPEAGILLPALLFQPSNKSKEAVLYCSGEGKARDAAVGGPIETFVKQGRAVLAVDLRGFGETKGAAKDTGWEPIVGGDWRDYYRAYLVGKSYVGMRVEDVYTAVRVLRARLGEGVAIHLEAVGQATVPALHAAALEPGLFASVTLRDGIPSWSDVVRTPRAKLQLMNAVHGALAWYDLPDLRDSLKDKPLRVIGEQVPEF